MNLLQDIITYVRRLIKLQPNDVITDALIIDYINRFWLMDMSARIQVFDLKKKYQFMTTPNVNQYNMPLYDIQTEAGDQEISYYPVYQGFEGPVFINGIQVPFYTQRSLFYNVWPAYQQTLVQAGTGNGSAGPYTLTLPFLPNAPGSLNIPNSSGIIRGHVDLNGIINLANFNSTYQDPPIGAADGSTIPVISTTSVSSAVYFTSTYADGTNAIIQDSGQFLEDDINYGLLMTPGKAPFGNTALTNQYSTSASITGASNTNPCVLDCVANFVVDQTVEISNVQGMTELNGNTYTVLANSGTQITINVDATGFGTYTGGGTASSFSNIINYLTGIATNVFFDDIIPEGVPIQGQCIYYQTGIPRACLYFDNVITLLAPPNTQYLVELDAYMTPAAFLAQGESLPFAYMAEYIARGAARKILADTGDTEQFMFYEPMFREQEILVWKRSQRQFTSTRTRTIYSTAAGLGTTGSNMSLGLQ